MRRDKILHVRVTHAVWKWILDDAASKRMTFSQWIRWLIKKEIESRAETP